jgi:uncharacterized protein YjiS (DUF1127 family)
MDSMLLNWWAAALRRQREKVLVSQLLLLNDHLLADIGLRRDQLQPDGIHALDVAPPPETVRQRVVRSPGRAFAPHLQGCG